MLAQLFKSAKQNQMSLSLPPKTEMNYTSSIITHYTSTMNVEFLPCPTGLYITINDNFCLVTLSTPTDPYDFDESINFNMQWKNSVNSSMKQKIRTVFDQIQYEYIHREPYDSTWTAEVDRLKACVYGNLSWSDKTNLCYIHFWTYMDIHDTPPPLVSSKFSFYLHIINSRQHLQELTNSFYSRHETESLIHRFLQFLNLTESQTRILYSQLIDYLHITDSNSIHTISTKLHAFENDLHTHALCSIATWNSAFYSFQKSL